MVQTYTIDAAELLKVLLHAAKYPASSVNGALVGKAEADGSRVRISAVIPLMHTSLSLAPGIETALAQADAYARTVGSSVVGVYHAEARFTATDMSSTARRVADRVASREPAACTLIVDAQKLKAWCDGGDGCPVDLMVRDAAARTWKRSGNAELVLDGGGTWGALHQRFLSHLSQQTHKRLVDFDQHLDDVSLDYLNKHLQL